MNKNLKVIKLKVTIFLLILSLISGCYLPQYTTDCPTVCKDIPFSKVATEITQAELEQGWYYGTLRQKKPGTPDNWIHSGEGYKSASWFAPSEETLDSCDCNKYSFSK